MRIVTSFSRFFSFPFLVYFFKKLDLLGMGRILATFLKKSAVAQNIGGSFITKQRFLIMNVFACAQFFGLTASVIRMQTRLSTSATGGRAEAAWRTATRINALH